MKIISAPAYQHERIADERIDSTGIPIPEIFAGNKVPLVVDHENDGDSPLRHISEIHGRSYLLTDTQAVDQPWLDQHGNPFQVITTKGNNLTRHHLLRSATAPSGFLPYGLQEGDALRRVARASRIMRSAGIDTERQLGVYQPQQLAYEGELVDVSDYKSLVIESMVKLIKSGEDTQGFTLEEVGAAAEVIDQMDFFVTLRAMSTAARIGDLVLRRTEPLGNSVVTGLNYDSLTEVFSDYNSYARAREGLMRELGLAPDLPNSVNGDTDRDALEHYFEEALPKLMAQNIGLLHSLGLMHHFPHENNFTGLGGIVDLDSVRGGKLRMKDPRDRNLFSSQVDEKTSISLETLGMFRRYQGHDIDWQKVTRHARENFTQVYMNTYNGSLSPRDRLVMIFVDNAFRPGGEIKDGSSLETESLERFYPGAKVALDEVEALATNALTDKVKIKLEELAWFYMDRSRNPFHLWGMDKFSGDIEDENGEILLNLGLPPSDEVILNSLPEYYEVSEESEYPYNEIAYMISLMPMMKARLLGDLKKSNLDIIQAFIERLPGAEDIDPQDVRQYLAPVQSEILKRLENKNEKPGFEEFWAIARTLFKEKVLDIFDRSIVPENEFIKANGIDLAPFVAFWQFHHRRARRGVINPIFIDAAIREQNHNLLEPTPIIEHVVSGLTKEQIASMVNEAGEAPEIVDTPEEVLQIEPNEGEEVRLMITDGIINNIIHYQDYGGKYEDINYRQYQKSDGSVPSNATEAVYLLQSDENRFRLVRKQLAQVVA